MFAHARPWRRTPRGASRRVGGGAAASAGGMASEVAVPPVGVRPVRDVMSTPVESVGLDAPVREAAEQMQRMRIGDGVVVMEAGQVRGIVTDRALTVRVIAEGRSLDTSVEQIMSPIAATVPSTATVSA